MGIAEDAPANPGLAGERQVAQGLDERPLAVHRLVQQLRVEIAGAVDGGRPEPLVEVPCLAEPVGGGGTELRSVRVSLVELGLHERRDVHPVDEEVLDLAVDAGVHHLDAAHHHSTQRGVQDRRPVEAHAAEA